MLPEVLGYGTQDKTNCYSSHTPPEVLVYGTPHYSNYEVLVNGTSQFYAPQECGGHRSLQDQYIERCFQCCL